MSSTKHYLGIDIGGTKCAVCIGDSFGNVLGKSTFPTNEPAGPEQAIEQFFVHSDNLLKAHNVQIEGIGIACGSPLDPEKGLVQSPAQLQSWRDVPVVKLFSERFKRPAFLDNDANAGALAEYCFGAGRGCKNMVFLTFGTGMGAGFVLDGRIYRGTNCYAGEVGHVRLAADGPVGCRKAGSFEGFCSGAGIKQILDKELAQFSSKTLLKSGDTAKECAKAAEQGDELALRIFEISGHHLGLGLAIILDVLNPERIVIGSIFARCEKFIRPSMNKALQSEALSYTYNVCNVVPAGLGEKIGDLAALSVAYSEMESRKN